MIPFFKQSKISTVVLLAASSIAVAGLLTACGGDPAPAAKVAAAQTELAAGPSTAAASTALFTSAPQVFTSGVPSFGTTGTTTLTVSNTTTSGTVTTASGPVSVSGPTFTITGPASGGGTGTASGALTYGSCIFNILSSTFVAPSPLLVGNQIVISPCDFKLATSGKPADGSSGNVTTTLTLGTGTSTGSTLTVTISNTGVVTVAGQTLGTVSLTPVTGGGS